MAEAKFKPVAEQLAYLKKASPKSFPKPS